MNPNLRYFLSIFTWEAATDVSRAIHSTVSIRSTRRRSTGVDRLGRDDDVRCEGTLDKWVSQVTLVTLTDWIVVRHCALGVDTTSTRAGINTLGVDTGKLLGTVVTQQTFRPACVHIRNQHFI